MRVESLRVAGCIAAVGFLLNACSPALNWRETRVEPTELVAMLPCKPDKASRNVQLAGQNLNMTMLGCDADAATFVVAYVDLPDPALASIVQSQWQASMLANMRATDPKMLPVHIKGLHLQTEAAVQAVTPVQDARQGPEQEPEQVRNPRPVLLQAAGLRADGRPVVAEALWFTGDSRIFHAVLYIDKPRADTLRPEAAEVFFSGLSRP